MREEIQVEHTPRGTAVTILERRSTQVWPIAQLRYSGNVLTGSWQLYAVDTRGRWLPYPELGRTARPGPLLQEIDRDPSGLFWG
ncbi:DUF3024 domain-containing protein [Pseudonocardiaceae bacterium YIM PH 21723]|nr:DUF3024 domain-containing protein [Pseudonocardiaceae bacterium YIM PH 21723]